MNSSSLAISTACVEPVFDELLVVASDIVEELELVSSKWEVTY